MSGRAPGRDDPGEFAAALARETDASLNASPQWRAGLPLSDDERWPWKSSGDGQGQTAARAGLDARREGGGRRWDG